MNTYSVNASVQYNDMQGTASADWQQSRTDLIDFAKNCGVDISKYNPIGLRIDLLESKEGEIEPGYVSIIAVNTEVVGTTYKEVRNYYSENGSLPVVVFHVKRNLSDILKQLKRFCVVLMSGYRDLENYELASEIDLIRE